MKPKKIFNSVSVVVLLLAIVAIIISCKKTQPEEEHQRKRPLLQKHSVKGPANMHIRLK